MLYIVLTNLPEVFSFDKKNRWLSAKSVFQVDYNLEHRKHGFDRFIPIIKNLRVGYFLIIALFSFFSCTNKKHENGYQPKAKGFNRIELPPHSYEQLKEEHPYSFDVSKAAIVQKDTFAKAEPHWIILYYPTINARIQLTYKPVLNDPKRLQAFIGDAYELARKHQVRATSEQTKIIKMKDGKMASIIELEGEVPTHFQFYTTDTTKNYLRGAVYLMQATENDSLRPVVDYMKIEAMHLLESLKWKKSE